MPKKARKGRIVNVDFEGVESGGRSCEDGTYPAIIHEIEEGESKEGNPKIEIKWKITGKKNNGVVIYDHVSLLPNALWRLKGLLEALGEEIPNSSVDLDLDDLDGREANIEVTNETWENKQRPRVTGYTSSMDKSSDSDEPVSAEEEGEEADQPTKRGPGRPKKVKIGAKVTFKDDKGKTINGTIIEIDADEILVKDTNKEDWELSVEDLTLL